MTEQIRPMEVKLPRTIPSHIDRTLPSYEAPSQNDILERLRYRLLRQEPITLSVLPSLITADRKDFVRQTKDEVSRFEPEDLHRLAQLEGARIMQANGETKLPDNLTREYKRINPFAQQATYLDQLQHFADILLTKKELPDEGLRALIKYVDNRTTYWEHKIPQFETSDLEEETPSSSEAINRDIFLILSQQILDLQEDPKEKICIIEPIDLLQPRYQTKYMENIIEKLMVGKDKLLPSDLKNFDQVRLTDLYGFFIAHQQDNQLFYELFSSIKNNFKGIKNLKNKELKVYQKFYQDGTFAYTLTPSDDSYPSYVTRKAVNEFNYAVIATEPFAKSIEQAMQWQEKWSAFGTPPAEKLTQSPFYLHTQQLAVKYININRPNLEIDIKELTSEHLQDPTLRENILKQALLMLLKNNYYHFQPKKILISIKK